MHVFMYVFHLYHAKSILFYLAKFDMSIDIIHKTGLGTAHASLLTYCKIYRAIRVCRGNSSGSIKVS